MVAVRMERLGRIGVNQKVREHLDLIWGTREKEEWMKEGKEKMAPGF